MKAQIEKHIYDGLKESQRLGQYCGFITNDKCNLGVEKEFSVKGTNIKFKAKCTQRGGMWSGTHNYVLTSALQKDL